MAHRFQRDDNLWRTIFPLRPDRATVANDEEEEPQEESVAEKFESRPHPPSVVLGHVRPTVDFLGWEQYRNVRSSGNVIWSADPDHPLNWTADFGALRATSALEVPRDHVHVIVGAWVQNDEGAGDGNWGYVDADFSSFQILKMVFLQGVKDFGIGSDRFAGIDVTKPIIIPPTKRFAFFTNFGLSDFVTFTMHYHYIELPIREYLP